MHTSRKVKGTFKQEVSEGTEMSMLYNSSGHHGHTNAMHYMLITLLDFSGYTGKLFAESQASISVTNQIVECCKAH